MTKTVLKIVSAAVLVAATAACTSSGEQGSPNPESSSSSSAPTSGSAGTLPARPAELKLDGVDACKLLTTAQMAEIKVAEAKPQQVEIADQDKMPGCFYKNGVQYVYTVALLTNKAAESWLDGKGNVTAKVVDVDGFGAAEITLTGTSAVDCSVGVDVAAGQQLYLSYLPTAKKGESQEQLCANVKKAAALAVQTLKTLK